MLLLYFSDGKLGCYNRPYIIEPQRIYRPGAFNGSTAQWLFRPNGKLAVTASSIRESASADLRVALRSTWTRYATHSSSQH
jgi:hypothetical protein